MYYAAITINPSQMAERYETAALYGSFLVVSRKRAQWRMQWRNHVKELHSLVLSFGCYRAILPALQDTSGVQAEFTQLRFGADHLCCWLLLVSYWILYSG